MARPETFIPTAGLPLNAVNLPLLGSRISPYGTFQYLLQSITANGATFAVPAWLTRREHFRVGDRIDFHFPFGSADGWRRQRAEVVEVHWEPAASEQVCRAEFRERQPLHHPVYVSVETGGVAFRSEKNEPLDPAELIRHLLRDCVLRKRGVAVYFKHLVPLFSRITLFPSAEYGALRQLVLEDVRQRIEKNISALEHWHARAEAGELSAANLSRDLDLESLRAAIEGEIEGELFDATFNTPAIQPYTSAIRLIEDKLYMNYNTLVLLYAHAL
jgi:hypothetical protein